MQSSPQTLRNCGVETPSPRLPPTQPHFQSTVSLRKLKRFNVVILVFRAATFCFTLAAAVFMLTNSGEEAGLPQWYDFDSFRFVLVANGIVAVYSLFEMGASVWEISRGSTVFPEMVQVWFDFGHDQVFAYLILSASSAGTELARTQREIGTCSTTTANNSSFCVQSDISIALGFAGFLFLGLSTLLSGFRVVCFIINGSRFHL